MTEIEPQGERVKGTSSVIPGAGLASHAAHRTRPPLAQPLLDFIEKQALSINELQSKSVVKPLPEELDTQFPLAGKVTLISHQ